jgi:hypothetical protein
VLFQSELSSEFILKLSNQSSPTPMDVYQVPISTTVTNFQPSPTTATLDVPKLLNVGFSKPLEVGADHPQPLLLTIIWTIPPPLFMLLTPTKFGDFEGEPARPPLHA